MENPFEAILSELNSIKDQQIKILEALAKKDVEPGKISLSDFCKQYAIARTTAYAWCERGLIRMEKLGGRLYVPLDSISIQKKYQRNSIA